MHSLQSRTEERKRRYSEAPSTIKIDLRSGEGSARVHISGKKLTRISSLSTQAKLWFGGTRLWTTS